MNSKSFRHFFVAAVVIGALLVGLGFAKIEAQTTELHNQQNQIAEIKQHEVSARATNSLIICHTLNGTRDYLRTYFNQTKAAQADQAKKFSEALNGKTGLNAEELQFLRLFIRSVVTLERSVPSVAHLHPFTLKDLDCQSLADRVTQAAKGEETESLAAPNDKMVEAFPSGDGF